MSALGQTALRVAPVTDRTTTGTGEGGRSVPRGTLWVVYAAISYVPLLLTKPGLIASDTKAYLYLDPGRLTISAPSMWNPVGMGTVTHQNIGYLFPMGPYFWLVQALHIPIWVGQRIWMGSLVFLAGAGAVYCCRRLGLTGAAAATAGLVYMLSPYIVDYIARESAIVMPWAALGWMIGLTATAARRGGWRHPALFALVVLLVGGVNATSIVLAGLAPAWWLIYAAALSREVSWREAAGAAARIVVLSVLVSLWWIAGLVVEKAYGYNILAVTETIPTVAATSSSAEVLRGLGYWYFYGQDKVQAWTMAGVEYMEAPWLIAVSFAVPAVAMLAGALARWRYRAFAVGLVLIGMLIGVATYPYHHPSPFGAALKSGSNVTSTIALAMRSTDRVVPLVALGLALLVGSGVAAVASRWTLFGLATAAAVAGVAAANLPPLWTGNLVGNNLSAPSSVPGYWKDAAAYLDAQGSSTRVLGVPGEDFAAYRWGVTQDQIAPGLMTRPYAQRQVVPQGTPASVDLLRSLDQPLQQGTLSPSAIAPVARMMSAGDILLQSDLSYERYQLPLPQDVAQTFNPVPDGLGSPINFGTPSATKPIKYNLYNEAQLAIPTGDPQPSPLSVYPVNNARPIVRTESASTPLIVAGNGSGVVNAAANGLLSGNPTVLYAATLDKQPQTFAKAIGSGAGLVLTDTNQLQGQRWGSVINNSGVVQQPGTSPLLQSDSSNYQNPLFKGETTSDKTVAQVSGVKTAQATTYGSVVDYTPEDQPLSAFDGDPNTAWEVSPAGNADGQGLRATLAHPVTTDQVSLSQVQAPYVKRGITDVTLLFDGKDPVKAKLDLTSLEPNGQVIHFPSRKFSRLDVVIDSTSAGANQHYDGLNAVGFSEVKIPGVAPATTTLRMPSDLLSQAGTSSQSHDLTILMNRQRAPRVPRADPETSISRQFSLPTGRSFRVGGTASIAYQESDQAIEQLTGALTNAPSSAKNPIVAANGSGRLIGALNTNALAAVDGNPNTAWVTEQGRQNGEWLSYTLQHPISFDHLELQVVNDGRHTLPTQVTITTENGSRVVDLPHLTVGKGRPQGSVTSVPISFAPLSGSQVKVTFSKTHEVTDQDYYAQYIKSPNIQPLGIAELGIPGVQASSAPAQIPATCRSNLVSVDGRPVDVAISGTSSTAMTDGELTVSPCGNSVVGITLGPGSHTVRTSTYLPSGFNVDSLFLASAAGGGVQQLTSAGTLPTVPTGPAPSVRVTHQDSTHVRATVSPTNQPVWLVLGQSQNKGWTASVNGRSLGQSTLIDGYANGWYLPAGTVSKPTVVTMSWTPQRVVWGALGVSAAAAVGSVVLAVVGTPERARPRRRRSAGPRRSAAAVAGLGPEVPEWRSVSPSWRKRPTWKVCLGVAVGCGLGAAIASSPVVGLIVAAAALVGVVFGRGTLLTRFGPTAVVVALGTAVIVQQTWYHYFPSLQWPDNFTGTNPLGWLAVTLLAASVVVDLVRARD